MSNGSENIWTVKAILDWCEGYLAQHGDANPRLSAQWLLGEAMGFSRIELYTNLDKPLSEEERATMRSWVVRRGKQEPLQLICGTAPFRHMVLEVAPGVLIPRPETEVLVSEVLTAFPPEKQRSAYAFEDDVLSSAEQTDEGAAKEVASDPAQQQENPQQASSGQGAGAAQAASDTVAVQTIRAIDLCTGSGCIACALATENANMEVLALDIAPEALALAQRNVVAQGVADKVEVLESDLLSAVVADPAALASFDLIVSNPPYIPSAVVDTLDSEVHDFEPRLALDGGEDGLDLFRRFIDDAHALLKPSGMLAIELFDESLEAARALALDHGFSEARIVADLAGKPRVLIALKA